MKNILFIHQSAELYGSDRTLLLLLKHLDKSKFNPIVVIPFDGPLKAELEKESIKVVIAPVLKLYRKMFSPKNILNFFVDIKQAFSVLNKLDKEYEFDLIYSNTLAVLLGVFFAKINGIKHLWHVHEIIESPKIFTRLFRKLLALKSNTSIVFNSHATHAFWSRNQSILSKSLVICNGLEIYTEKISNNEILQIRKQLFNSDSLEIVIALVGRISKLKGQILLLEAFYQITKSNSNVRLVFIGSPPPNQELYLEELQQQIKELNLTSKVTVLPFTNEIFKIWQSIDIAIVPSTEPESFGLVALEAMLAKKAVVASNHGGLTEIILNNETGFLVEPNNKKQLAEAISKLIESPELRKQFGEKGYQRAINKFSAVNYIDQFEKLLLEV